MNPDVLISASATSRAYEHVKRAILQRTYPGGALLTEGELSDAVGVSRTPVREALLRLEGEGLVRLYPKKGALVLPVSAEEINDVIEARLMVEVHAVERALARPAQLADRLAELLEEMRSFAARGEVTAFISADRSFHRAFVEAAGNDILSRLYDLLRDRQLRMGVALMSDDPTRLDLAVAEHAGILAAVRAADQQAVTEAVRGHVHTFASMVGTVG